MVYLPAAAVAGATFLLVLWLLLFSPVSPVLRTVMNVLTDPLSALASTIVAAGVAYYVVVYVLQLSLFV
ncbi:MAG: hypothetical protein GXO07_05400 [Crenarchaeota archaeon]|nr:hypothetical protein [Thermoproteota archaeon]